VREAEWCASAAYLYALHLDALALAWEYLRRNRQYIRDWRSGMVDCAGRWPLSALENPCLDASMAQPMWRPRPEGEICITAVEDAPACAMRFDLWALPGEKTLVHDGKRLVASFRDGGSRMRIAIDPQLRDGTPFGYLVASCVRPHPLPRRLEAILCAPRSRDPHALAVTARRDAIVHMRTLQALDGALANASQRDVAGALFGVDQVAISWQPDSELRAMVRHYIRRGRELMDGAYTQMLTHPNERLRRMPR
jgi:hypothetical protein